MFPVYTVIGGLAMAASMPLLSPASILGADAVERSTTTAGVRASQVVLVSSALPTPIPTAAAISFQTTSVEDRWWRDSQSRLSTTSIVKMPPKTSEAILAAEAVAAITNNVVPPAPTATPTPRPTSRPAPFVDARLGTSVPAAVRRYEPLILRYGKQFDVDPSLIAAVILTESSGDADAVSPMNAVGLMQVLDGPFDPEENLARGVKLLAKYLTRYQRLDMALAAYNAGPGNVAKHGGIPPFPETHLHIARTLASYTAWKDRATV